MEDTPDHDRWVEVNRNSEGIGISLYTLDENSLPVLVDEWYALKNEVAEFHDDMDNVVLGE